MLKRAAKLVLPERYFSSVYPPLRSIYRRFTHFGFSRKCPICGKYYRRFARFTHSWYSRPDAMCINCSSLERHRSLWLYLQRYTPVFDGTPKKVLHLAPEEGIGKELMGIPCVDYLAGDLEGLNNSMRIDITGTEFPDDVFDIILCMHILEHIPEDRKAMRELCRILTPGGKAIIQVPQRSGETLEDPSVTSPEERARLYGQEDHVRIYGDDFGERLQNAGFQAGHFVVSEHFSSKEIVKYRLFEDASTFICTK